MNELIVSIIQSAIPVIFAITLHEAAHGYAARLLGDPTAYQAGRISLNPLRHVDPIGTLLVPGLILLGSLLFGGKAMFFGWAKPVPVQFARLNNPRRDMILVAAAGPFANLLMAFIWCALVKILLSTALIPSLNAFFLEMCIIGLQINLILMIFNPLPIPPLDGGRIAVGLLPDKLALPLARLEPFGFIIIVALLATGVLSKILWPVLNILLSFFITLFQLR